MDGLPLGDILMGLFGGLALFLLGMEQMAGALKSVAGDRMRWVLARLTGNRFAGVLTGAFVTAVIQSSSVTTVLVVGFVSAGLMTLTQSVGVIMGANIGTTVTAQIVAFKVTEYALALVALGFAVAFVARTDRIKQYGTMLLGLGLVFFGMAVMSGAMQPLKGHPPFIEALAQAANPLTAVAMGAVFTALVQSSSATTGIVIVLASEGFIPLEMGIALAFGANIGTCVTALLATIGKPREALRAAVIHALFNVLGVVLWIGLIGPLADLVRILSPVAENLQGTARLAAEAPRQIANAHTVFNIANTLLFVGFAGFFAKAAHLLVPERPPPPSQRVQPRFLSPELLETPVLALDATRHEIARIGERVRAMSAQALPALLDGDGETLAAVRALDGDVDDLHEAVILYLRSLGLKSLSSGEAADMVRLMRTADYVEQIGDLVETDMVELGYVRLSKQVTVSEETRSTLITLHALTDEAIRLALLALVRGEKELAEQVMTLKAEVDEKARIATDRVASRLTADSPGRLASYRLETQLIERLKRIFYFAKRIAKEVADRSESAGPDSGVREPKAVDPAAGTDA